ncbi:hypothetical protein Q4Y15_000710 [Campylobacter fetus]|uniref:Excinuclease ABC subunit A n=2 Tax=Campylobacter fetus TaxID=196 RepID=A0RMX6_CAMFF|nr:MULTISPECIES: hypothetical protein [Campylobacter]HDX6329887.1 hypothetical protein [Campylobacter fetus subsp. venerealis]ABK82377.1 conserved hypothetical protein [Campylobacter fetus subsp. fetus 82-40]AIR78303.1 putative membrane protein [Campylobacter fetus subsp. fetus 04/554]EAH8299830.1 hypothetical protein [Campylobacter fetus]EAI3886405.1 hypothetical protein [Campylobacter fetus]
MRFIILLFATLPLFGVNLLTYNIYERGDRVDIMLSFDSPYDGSIKQQVAGDKTSLMLSDLNVEEQIDKSINSSILQNIFISSPNKLSTLVELKSNLPIAITASKTPDKFGLRIRVANIKTNQNQAAIPSNIQTKDNTVVSADIDSRYISVIVVLLILFFISFIIKKRLAKPKNDILFTIGDNIDKKPIQPSEPKEPIKQDINRNSAFSVSDPSPTKTEEIKTPSWELKTDDGGVEVIYEKSIDNTNKVALLSYENRKYLVLVGSSNVLLDKFGEDKIRDKEDFEVFFEENRQKLGRYLEDRKNSLSSYKDMMSKE